MILKAIYRRGAETQRSERDSVIHFYMIDYMKTS